MRVALAEVAPVLRDPAANAARASAIVRAARADLVVLPEMFLTGYRLGDDVHRLAIEPAALARGPIGAAARETGAAVVVGAPVRGPRPGEVANAAVLVGPDGSVAVQAKRYLPTYGPFEEGALFSAGSTSEPVRAGAATLGLAICYDAFFPEVFTPLAVGGAEMFAILSAAPVTSRRLFEKVLPARAVENAVPLVYVNRVGVEDGLVFGGGSGAWDVRGEPIPLAPVALDGLGADERVGVAPIDLADAARWRPFRPVVRDRAARPGPPPAADRTARPRSRRSIRTGRL